MTIGPDDILQARQRIVGAVVHTPVVHSRTLSGLCGCDALFKLENLQMTGSFKERGALNRLLQISDEERSRGVIAASAGNHAQGVAFHAERLGIHAQIVMPEGTPLIKVRSTQGYGAEVVLHGMDYDDAYAHARSLAEKTGAVFVHAFADSAVIAGQGTIGIEITEDPLCRELDAVIVPVGGGGLIGGIGAWIKHVRPDVRVVGVEPDTFPSMKRSLEKGEVVLLPKESTLADGIAVRQVSEMTLALARAHVDQIVTVSADEIANAVLLHLEIEKILVEGAGATPLAALLNRGEELGLHGQRVACVVSGGNMDVNVLDRIIVRGLAHDGRIADFTVVVPDTPGALEAVLHVLKNERANVLDVAHHRYGTGAPLGRVAISITAETRGPDHIGSIHRVLREKGYDLS